jgi:hypothetical protein
MILLCFPCIIMTFPIISFSISIWIVAFHLVALILDLPSIQCFLASHSFYKHYVLIWGRIEN